MKKCLEKIEIRKSPSKNSNVIYVDVDGYTVWAEYDKKLLKEYIFKLIDKI